MTDAQPTRIQVSYSGFTVVYDSISDENFQSLRGGSYNEGTFMEGILKERIAPGMTVFDVGAHTGLWTIPFAKSIENSGKVYAFEPIPELLAAIKHNLDINGLTNANLQQIAISNYDGTRDFYVRPGTEMNSLFETNPLSQDNTQYTISVQTSRIDTFVRERSIAVPSFVKIDVEGAELLVIEGMEHVARHVDSVLVEIHHLQLAAQGFTDPEAAVTAALRDIGFTVFKKLGTIHLLAQKA